MPDRRTYPRCRTSVGVKCFTGDDNGTACRRGATQDISSSGLIFQIPFDQRPDIGKRVALQLYDLFSERRPARGRKNARVFGTVKRILTSPSENGEPAIAHIAVEFDEKPFAPVFDLAE